MTTTPRVIYDCFVDRDNVEYICEVYTAYDGHIEDFGVYPLLEDGSKGSPVENASFADELQENYYSNLIAGCDDDVI